MQLREIILTRLKEQMDSFVSGQALADEFLVSKVAIWKHIEALKALGYNIVAVQNRGYRLLPSPSGFHAATAQAKLNTNFLGRTLEYFPEVASTNEVIKQKLAAGENLPNGYTVVAARQQTGKGRKGSSWDSPLGGLWFSGLFLPMLPAVQLSLFSVAFSVAVAEVLEELTALQMQIHWPNAIYTAETKICGMLLEAQGELERIERLILGAGIYANQALNQQESLDHPTLEFLTGETYDLNQLCSLLLNRIELSYQELVTKGAQKLLESYKMRLRYIGDVITVTTPQAVIKGKFLDLDHNGFLLIEDEKSQQRLLIPAGDISN